MNLISIVIKNRQKIRRQFLIPLRLATFFLALTMGLLFFSLSSIREQDIKIAKTNFSDYNACVFGNFKEKDIYFLKNFIHLKKYAFRTETSADKNYFDTLKPLIREGHAPQSTGEILIPINLNLNIGQKIHIDSIEYLVVGKYIGEKSISFLNYEPNPSQIKEIRLWFKNSKKSEIYGYEISKRFNITYNEPYLAQLSLIYGANFLSSLEIKELLLIVIAFMAVFFYYVLSRLIFREKISWNEDMSTWESFGLSQNNKKIYFTFYILASVFRSLIFGIIISLPLLIIIFRFIAITPEHLFLEYPKLSLQISGISIVFSVGISILILLLGFFYNRKKTRKSKQISNIQISLHNFEKKLPEIFIKNDGIGFACAAFMLSILYCFVLILTVSYIDLEHKNNSINPFKEYSAMIRISDGEKVDKNFLSKLNKNNENDFYAFRKCSFKVEGFKSSAVVLGLEDFCFNKTLRELNIKKYNKPSKMPIIVINKIPVNPEEKIANLTYNSLPQENLSLTLNIENHSIKTEIIGIIDKNPIKSDLFPRSIIILTNKESLLSSLDKIPEIKDAVREETILINENINILHNLLYKNLRSNQAEIITKDSQQREKESEKNSFAAFLIFLQIYFLILGFSLISNNRYRFSSINKARMEILTLIGANKSILKSLKFYRYIFILKIAGIVLTIGCIVIFSFFLTTYRFSQLLLNPLFILFPLYIALIVIITLLYEN